MEGDTPVRKVWRKLSGETEQTPAEVALSKCSDEISSIQCWTSQAGAVEMAVFLQDPNKHSGNGSVPDNIARIKIAYRTYHPKPIHFKRCFSCVNGDLDEHDCEQKFEMRAGKTTGRSFQSALVTDGVNVVRGPDGAQITAKVKFDRDGPTLSPKGEADFSLLFAADEELQCSCCMQ